MSGTTNISLIFALATDSHGPNILISSTNMSTLENAIVPETGLPQEHQMKIRRDDAN
jgi:hypothetical protein